jgi:hypothetical protein
LIIRTFSRDLLIFVLPVRYQSKTLYWLWHEKLQNKRAQDIKNISFTKYGTHLKKIADALYKSEHLLFIILNIAS